MLFLIITIFSGIFKDYATLIPILSLICLLESIKYAVNVVIESLFYYIKVLYIKLNN